MKKYLILLFLFPLCLFGAINPAVYTIQNIDQTESFITLDDGSVWEGHRYRQWREGDRVVINYDDEYGFSAKNLEIKRSLFVGLITSPEPYVTEFEESYFMLSNGLALERKPYMTLDIGDRIFLCGYSINIKADEVVIYNVSKPWIGDRTKFFNNR